MSDQSQPIFAADDAAELPELRARHPLTTGRFLRALAVACVLYFVILVALASFVPGSLALFISIVPAVWASSKLNGLHGMGIHIAVGILAFFIVNVTAYAVLVLWYTSSGGLVTPGG